jgi:hypothetical protein
MAGDRPDNPVPVGGWLVMPGASSCPCREPVPVPSLTGIEVRCPHCGAPGPHTEVAAGADFEAADCRACGQRFELEVG